MFPGQSLGCLLAEIEDGLDKTESGLVFEGAGLVEEAKGFFRTNGGEEVVTGNDLAGLQFNPFHRFAPAEDARDPGTGPDLSSMGLVVGKEEIQKVLDAASRSEHALFKDGPEHDNKLSQIHVVFQRRSIVHEGAEQHVGEQVVRQELVKEFPGRGKGGRTKRIILRYPLDKPSESRM